MTAYEKQRLIAAGYAAHCAGCSRCDCPGDMVTAHYWLIGWWRRWYEIHPMEEMNHEIH